MTRPLTASLIAVAALLMTTLPAGAKPAGPASCEFVLGFAAFRDAVGPSVVGDCAGNQLTDQNGNAHQYTTRGNLDWDAKNNLVTFRDRSRLWFNGPGDLRSDVVISGLTADQTALTIRARASLALAALALSPADLGPTWRYGVSPLFMPHSSVPGCGALLQSQMLGTVQTRLYDRETKRTISQGLSAFPEWDATPTRASIERWVDECGDMHYESDGIEIHGRVSVLPFTPMGDESYLLRFEFEVPEFNMHIAAHMAVVRYGGLLSQVADETTLAEGATTADTPSLESLIDLAARADARIHNAICPRARSSLREASHHGERPTVPCRPGPTTGPSGH